MQNDLINDNTSFYFLGIGGTSMSALAGFMLYSGKKTGGYDARQSVYTDNLLKLGAEISFSDDQINVDGYDVLVYTDAFHTDDARIVRARKLKKTVL